MTEEVTKDKSKTTESTRVEQTFAHKAAAKFRKFAIYLIIVIVIALVISIVSEKKEADKIASWNKILTATFTAQTNFTDLAAEVAKANTGISGTGAAQYGDMLIMSSAGITYDREKLELAKKAGEEFISSDPQNPFINQVKLDYGTVLFNLEDYEGAIKSYQEVINSNTTYLVHEALLYKALAQEKLGKDAEAIETYTAVIDNISKNKKVTLANFADYASFARTQLIDKKVEN